MATQSRQPAACKPAKRQLVPASCPSQVEPQHIRCVGQPAASHSTHRVTKGSQLPRKATSTKTRGSQVPQTAFLTTLEAASCLQKPRHGNSRQPAASEVTKKPFEGSWLLRALTPSPIEAAGCLVFSAIQIPRQLAASRHGVTRTRAAGCLQFGSSPNRGSWLPHRYASRQPEAAGCLTNAPTEFGGSWLPLPSRTSS